MSRQEEVSRRVLEEANYIISKKATVRETAKSHGVSKSTVHHDLTVKLRQLSPQRYKEVKDILDVNKAERHIRGGEATRQKYLSK